MRIAVDARPLCVPTTGIGRYTREMLDRLTPVAGTTWFLYADRPLLRDYGQHANVVQRTFPSANHAASLLRTQWTFARWARRDAVDLFWSPRHHLPLLLDRGIRTAVTVHDLVWRLFPETMMPANRFIERLLMPSSLRRADVILCVSEATKADVVTHFPGVAEKTIVIHEAATPMAAPPLDRAGNYFLFVGTLEPRKNLGRVIEAFARAKEKGLGDCKLVIVGAEGWGDRIDAVVSAAGLGNDVELPGHVDDVELHQKLAGAIALLLPSLHEGFGLPALEAMQYGTPVIGANVSSIPEIVGDGGILVDPLSKTSISEALIILATDAERRQVLADNARRQAAKFSWEQAADETLAAFSALIANASQRTDGK